MFFVLFCFVVCLCLCLVEVDGRWRCTGEEGEEEGERIEEQVTRRTERATLLRLEKSKTKINKYLANLASLSSYFSPYLRLCFRLSSNGASLPFTRRLLLHISPPSSNPSLWLTSILPLILRGSSSPSPTIQEIPNPISLINTPTFHTPQSCHPSRTTSPSSSSNHHNHPTHLALFHQMTNTPRNCQTSQPPRNPTNLAIPSLKLLFSQNSTR